MTAINLCVIVVGENEIPSELNFRRFIARAPIARVRLLFSGDSDQIVLREKKPHETCVIMWV